MGKRTVFLSNNPTHTREEYAAKLTRLGLPTPDGGCDQLLLRHGRFFAAAMPGPDCLSWASSLCARTGTRRVHLTDQAPEVDAVIASFDRTFVYRKLQIAFDAINHGARFFATNADRYCPCPAAANQTRRP
jgi:arabinose operon protein AraL